MRNELIVPAVALALAVGFGTGCASTTPPSPQGLETNNGPDFQSIQAFIDEVVADGRAPAAIAMIGQQGDMTWLGTAGEMGPGVPMQRDAIIPLASVGKMHTALAAMILVERGDIKLDDPVSKYIAEFDSVQVETQDESGVAKRVGPDTPITVYHLLTHTAGLTVRGEQFQAAWDAHSEKTTTTHLARAMSAIPLSAQPGSGFDYGIYGASYEVVGAVIEQASGQTLEAFMSANVFEPLGLKSTFFYVPQEHAQRVPAFYSRQNDALVLARKHGEDFKPTTFFHGGGGVQSSPQDIMRFAQLFLDGGEFDGTLLVKPETIATMMSDHLGDRSPLPAGYSWGIGAAVRMLDKGPTPQQYGWVGGNYAKLWIDPSNELVAFVAFTLTPPGDGALLQEFEERVYQAIR